MAILNAERLARSTLDACIDPNVPAEKRARLALDVIDAVDPQPQLTLSTALDAADIDNMSLSEAMALAEAHNVPLPALDGVVEPSGDFEH